jgi:NADH-quinone oxidoreductase subunit I
MGRAPGYRGAPYLVKDQEGPHQMRLLPALRICLSRPRPSGSRRPGRRAQLAEVRECGEAPKEFEINMLRCIFCGYCQEVCPEEAIFLMQDYSLTGTSRQEMIYNKEKLLSLGGCIRIKSGSGSARPRKPKRRG